MITYHRCIGSIQQGFSGQADRPAARGERLSLSRSLQRIVGQGFDQVSRIPSRRPFDPPLPLIDGSGRRALDSRAFPFGKAASGVAAALERVEASGDGGVGGVGLTPLRRGKACYAPV